MAAPTRNCDECAHLRFVQEEFFPSAGDPPPKAYCTKKHALRFYKPKSPRDTDWGYKKRCLSFKEKE